MGVSGSGKTTVGERVAARMGWGFRDADDFHPAANVAKMGRGEALVDADRWPWLERLRREVVGPALAGGERVVLACSALKASHRAVLLDGVPEGSVALVFLSGDAALLRERLQARRGHYMKAGLLESQFAALEPPGDEAVEVAVDRPVDEVVDAVLRVVAGARGREG
jgi:carbohydrate kinase (thermoresistant glucokinase family)